MVSERHSPAPMTLTASMLLFLMGGLTIIPTVPIVGSMIDEWQRGGYVSDWISSWMGFLGFQLAVGALFVLLGIKLWQRRPWARRIAIAFCSIWVLFLIGSSVVAVVVTMSNGPQPYSIARSVQRAGTGMAASVLPYFLLNIAVAVILAIPQTARDFRTPNPVARETA